MTATPSLQLIERMPAAGRQPVPLIPARAGYEHLTTRERSALDSVATRAALMQRLRSVGELAPDAPLSFLAIQVEGIEQDDASPPSGTTLRAIARELSAALGPFDLAGRLGVRSFGVVLQGKGSQATSLLAMRLEQRLNALAETGPAVRISIHAASGTGRNAEVLPAAAADSLPDVG